MGTLARARQIGFFRGSSIRQRPERRTFQLIVPLLPTCALMQPRRYDQPTRARTREMLVRTLRLPSVAPDVAIT